MRYYRTTIITGKGMDTAEQDGESTNKFMFIGEFNYVKCGI